MFVAAGDAVTAFRSADGTKVWSRAVGQTVYHLWLSNGRLIVNADQVIDDAKIPALDPTSGQVQWTYPVPGAGFLGDAVLTSDDGLAFTLRALKAVSVLDLATGQVRWTVTDGHPNPNTPPSIADGLVLIFGTDETLTARDSRSAAIRWLARNVHAVGRVVVSGDVGVVEPGSGPTTVVAYSLNGGPPST